VKPSLIVAIALAVGVYFTPWCEGQNGPGKGAAKPSQNAKQPATPPVSYQIDNQRISTEAHPAVNQPPDWYKSPEWILVFVGSITAVFIAWQSWETRRSASSARRALVLAQRPRISVRAFYFTQDEGVGGSYFGRHYVIDPSFCSGQFCIQNSGGTDAKIKEVYCETYVAARLPMKRPYEGEKWLSQEKTLRPGESWPYCFGRPMKGPDPSELGTKGRIERAMLNFYVLGNIHYTDGLGIYRITNFCRRYDVGEDRFIPESNPDYENEA
jgi:hypothetical protein